MANAFANAVYNEDQRKKLLEIYQNQGAGAATSAALAMANQQAQGATPSTTGSIPITNTGTTYTQQGTVGATTGATGATTGRTPITVPGTSSTSQGTAGAAQGTPIGLQQAMDSAEKARILNSGNQQLINQYLIDQAKKQAQQMTPYQEELAKATAPTSTSGGRMEDGTFRLGDGSTYGSLQDAINANAGKNQYEITTGENGETLYDGMPLMNGTGILAAKGDLGGVSYPNGGSSYFYDAEGKLHVNDGTNRWFRSSNGYMYDRSTATDDELWRHGMVRDKNGDVRIANKTDQMLYEMRNGADPTYIAKKYYGTTIPLPQNTPQSTTPQNTTPQGGQSGNTAPLPQNTTPQGSGYSGGGTVPIQGSGNGSGNTGNYPSGGSYPSGGTGNGTGYTPYQPAQNPYQAYLDQFDYGKAPEWTGTEYERQRDEALQNARSMQWNGSDYQNQRDELLKNAMNPYEGSPYDQQRDDALAAYGEAWQGSEYQPKRDAALQRAENMQWNYDPNADPVWQALQKQYRREGDRATREALGQAASMTGGVPSSYAVTAASQAGDYYASQLSDRLPQVYQDAYNRYLQEFQRQMGISDQYQGFDDREYSRWADQQGKNLDLADRYNQYGQQDYGQYMDRVSQQLSGADRYNAYDQNEYQRYLDQYGQQLDAADRYNQYGATEYDRYRDRLGQWNTDRNFQYGLNRDAVSDARYADETAYERAWNEENRDYSRNYQARRDAILDNRADREWAQELTEYADAQGWKRTEWEQYLREYGDQLTEKEREWAYQMSRDAEGDKRYWTDYEYQKTRDAEADKRYWDESDYKKHRDEITDQQYYDERDYEHKQDELDWKYKQDEFNYKKDQDEKSWDYTEQQDAYQKYLDAYDMGQKETESGKQDYLEAIAFLDTYGIVEGRYADILGVPPGTTRDEYWARYNKTGDEGTQSDSGGYYDNGGGNPPPQTEPPAAPETDPESNSNLYEFSNERHANGNKMTKGFRSKMAELKADKAGGASDEEIENKVRQLIADHVITNYEGGLILYELGSHAGGGRQSHGIQDLTTEPFGE